MFSIHNGTQELGNGYTSFMIHWLFLDRGGCNGCTIKDAEGTAYTYEHFKDKHPA